MKALYLTALLMFSLAAGAQHIPEGSVQPESKDKNIEVHALYHDSLQSGFMIWIRNEVKAHRHNAHSEVVVVLEGKAKMSLNGESFRIRKGDVVRIPKGAVHSVQTLSRKPLKVLSVQSPFFDGSDREWIQETP
jgi:mannose-6-phosphate isomerase-like protein (cupin superfamily)